MVNAPPKNPYRDKTFDVFLVLSIIKDIGSNTEIIGHKSNKNILLVLKEYVYGSCLTRKFISFSIKNWTSLAYLNKIKYAKYKIEIIK